MHGYGVIERLRVGSGGLIDLPTGTIYPALHRLERAGLVHSHWSTESGRRRRSSDRRSGGTSSTRARAGLGPTSVCSRGRR